MENWQIYRFRLDSVRNREEDEFYRYWTAVLRFRGRRVARLVANGGDEFNFIWQARPRNIREEDVREFVDAAVQNELAVRHAIERAFEGRYTGQLPSGRFRCSGIIAEEYPDLVASWSERTVHQVWNEHFEDQLARENEVRTLFYVPYGHENSVYMTTYDQNGAVISRRPVARRRTGSNGFQRNYANYPRYSGGG